MKKTTIMSGFLVVFMFWACSKSETTRNPGQSDQTFKFKVKVVTAQKGTFQKYINYKGTVTAWKTANIMPEVSGRIARIHQNVGEEVKAGELLAELDLTALKLQLVQAEASHRVAEKGCQDARLNKERMEKLFEKNAVSSFQLEKARLALSAAETQQESARAMLDIIRFNIEKSQMKAPFDGLISARNLEVGDMVNPMMGNGKAVVELLDLSRIKVLVDLNAEDIERVNLGQECRVKVAGLDRDLTGRVFSKSLAADPGSKTFRVEISLPNDEKEIRVNVFADVWIEIEKQEGVLTLPLPALLSDRYLMVVEGDRARRIEIKKGGANEEVFVVDQGLQPGQVVIVDGNYDLQDGQEVIF